MASSQQRLTQQRLYGSHIAPQHPDSGRGLCECLRAANGARSGTRSGQHAGEPRRGRGAGAASSGGASRHAFDARSGLHTTECTQHTVLLGPTHGISCLSRWSLDFTKRPSYEVAPRVYAFAGAGLRRRLTGAGASGGKSDKLLRFYTDDSPGLKLPPVRERCCQPANAGAECKLGRSLLSQRAACLGLFQRRWHGLGRWLSW